MKVSDQAVWVASRVYNEFARERPSHPDAMHAALQGAMPWLLADRDAVKEALVQALGLSKGVLATTHQHHGFDSGCPVCRGKSDEIAEEIVDNLLGLLNGSAAVS